VALNYQIEHHLFPSMPCPLLKMAQPVVRQYCHEVNISYRESGFIESMREIHGYLRQAGA
jgi:fatty acid desaturase